MDSVLRLSKEYLRNPSQLYEIAKLANGISVYSLQHKLEDSFQFASLVLCPTDIILKNGTSVPSEKEIEEACVNLKLLNKEQTIALVKKLSGAKNTKKAKKEDSEEEEECEDEDYNDDLDALEEDNNAEDDDEEDEEIIEGEELVDEEEDDEEESVK
jgi:hypothetical protein